MSDAASSLINYQNIAGSLPSIAVLLVFGAASDRVRPIARVNHIYID